MPEQVQYEESPYGDDRIEDLGKSDGHRPFDEIIVWCRLSHNLLVVPGTVTPCTVTHRDPESS